MATSGSDPQLPKPSGLQGAVSSSRTGAQSKLLHSENERQSPWSPFPMGQRPKNTFRKTSSYLLQQLIHCSQESDVDRDYEDQEEGEGKVEFEESSESEMLNFEDLDLIDISILCGYIHLQKLDLSVNKIEDLSCVSCMPYLLELNASQNKLTTFFNFKPPKNLKGVTQESKLSQKRKAKKPEARCAYKLNEHRLLGVSENEDMVVSKGETEKVDFSYNQISEMCDLSAYESLTKLILDSNEIAEINGLELCSSLTHLSLAKNKITTINGLGMLPIKILCLSNNQIEKITGLDDLRVLQILDLSHNQISSLQGLESHDFLEVINLEDNKIAELGEIEYIENLRLLRVLSLLRNPIREKSDYCSFVIFMLLRLTELDQKKIGVEEKVVAVNKYNPPPEVVAAQDHMTHVFNSLMQPQRIFDSTLPSLDAPYPMLVLAGPQACGTRELAHRLCRQFSTYFRYGACHTTRLPYFREGDRVDYHFISQEVFDEMLNMGKFILTFNYGNHKYGLSRDTIEDIARDGLASCVHMEIEGVRSLKHSYFEPRYILVVPMDKKKYEGYLRRKGLFSRIEIEFAVSRVDLYIKINQKYPGYFDAVVNADDLDVAYQTLSQLIREYLGLSEATAKSLAPTTADIKKPQLKPEKTSKKFRALSEFESLDFADRNYFVKLWAKLSGKNTPAERESMARQYETARQALMGKTPPHHTFLFQRGLVPAPVINSLRCFTALELKKNFELPGGYFKTPFGPSEKSGMDSSDSMKYSALFESCPWSKDLPIRPPEDRIYSHPESTIGDIEDQALKALHKQVFPCGKGSLQHRRHTISSISRPGSNTKPTLPPIPQGRK
ncbi:leucine-rich repeat and guanylate kinase domain-containing protein isoform X3 [Phocoena sinus]|uniref:leucine-rich repeat and guanylate kinase domain-containing protein isoform X3 n=1 Tax=Phocoena sinus TaxID=42100 RepID=UPI0013C49646|nr:leucine-rich repeat and guanylate kinase domain-containing protein isoform X3 [Phocoena sinus]